MKRYTINCHYDMVISVDVIADNEQQALRLAYDKAAGMSIDGAECVGHSECVADTEEQSCRLLVVFSDKGQYRRARDFYCLKASEAPTAFYAEEYSDEFCALCFKEDPDTLDALERDLTEDLEYYGFIGYHFEQD